jgi:hypothetical protein
VVRSIIKDNHKKTAREDYFICNRKFTVNSWKVNVRDVKLGSASGTTLEKWTFWKKADEGV